MTSGEQLLDRVLMPSHALAWGLLDRGNSVSRITVADHLAVTENLLEVRLRLVCLAAACQGALGIEVQSPADLHAGMIEALDLDQGDGPLSSVVALAIAALDAEDAISQAEGLIRVNQVRAFRTVLCEAGLNLILTAEAALEACSQGRLRCEFNGSHLRLVWTRRRKGPGLRKPVRGKHG